MTNVEWESRKLIERALSIRATDIHFHPREKETSLLFRIHGQLHGVSSIKKRHADRLIAHFKFRAGMDIGEQRRPQNGSFMIKDTSPPVHLRFSTMPSYLRESLSIRLLPQDSFFELTSLSFHPPIVSFFHTLLTKSSGIIVLTGPTGSGKTTSLYAFMNELAHLHSSRIVSVEDPVEIRNDTFIQAEVNQKAGLSYKELMKASLRHDPDVLMIGEIRDESTAQLAIRASLTGHLVLTTMHASSPAAAVQRLIDFGCSALDLQETLLCITSQFLKPRYCPYCAPRPCSPYCKTWGYSSRLAVFDILAGKQLKECLFDRKKSSLLTFSSADQFNKGVVLKLFSGDSPKKGGTGNE